MKINIDDFIQIFDKRDDELLIEGNVVKIGEYEDENELLTKVLLDTGYEITISRRDDL